MIWVLPEFAQTLTSPRILTCPGKLEYSEVQFVLEFWKVLIENNDKFLKIYPLPQWQFSAIYEMGNTKNEWESLDSYKDSNAALYSDSVAPVVQAFIAMIQVVQMQFL